MEQTEQEILQKHLINFLVKDVYNAILPDEIWSIRKGVLTHKGRPLTKDESKQLKEEATLFAEGKLWSLLKSELNHIARVKMYEKSVSEKDIVAGKLLIYLTECIDNRLSNLK